MKKQKKRNKAIKALKAKESPEIAMMTDDEVQALCITCIIFVMMSGRIPTKFEEFHNYLTVVLPWLNAIPTGGLVKNGVRLGMDPADVTACATWLSDWTSGDSLHPKIYEKNADKTEKNQKATDAYNAYEKNFNDWFHPQLDIMAAKPGITDDDRLILHIKEVPTAHHRPTAKIAEVPLVNAAAGATACIKLTNKLPGDTSKANLPAGADAVEITYACFGKVFTPSPELGGIVRETEPEYADQCTWRESHSAAVFEVVVKPQLSTFKLKGWARYIDSKNRKRDGNWSLPFELNVP